MNILRIAAYVRVSTEEQAEQGNSIYEQQERLAAYCKAMAWDVPEFFIDDGYSAKNLKRPAISKLLQDIEQKKFDVIVATKLDRVCRNLLDLLNLVEIFELHQCRFVSASESFDTSTAAGRMTLHLLGMFAEFERERISERVKDNMLSLAKNTNKALSGACFGYDIIDGHYVINENEAQFVRFMFDRAEEGLGTRSIAKLLNELGSCTKKGKPWDSVNVKRLMVNQNLTGTRIFNIRKNVKGKIKIRDKNEWVIKQNSHPAIISETQFETVQRIFESRKPTRTRAESETYLLTGIIYCKRCGARMKGHTARHKTQIYYRYLCSSYVLRYGCDHHYVQRDELEAFVINQIKQISESSNEQIEALIKHVKSNEDEINQIQTQLTRIEKRMQKQIEAFEHDLISAHDLKLARERIEHERNKLQEHLHQLVNNKKGPTELKSNASKYVDDITSADRVKAKKSISLLIERIEVNAPTVDIIWRL